MSRHSEGDVSCKPQALNCASGNVGKVFPRDGAATLMVPVVSQNKGYFKY